MATSLVQLLTEYKVEIPIIQRDYAQGRKSGNVPKIRERFLNCLLEALKPDSEKLELDFVYGYISDKQREGEKKTFIPLDGQQRLTTLFLLHWFVAYKENKLDDTEVKSVLLSFSYETRHSSRVFCEKIISEKILTLSCVKDKDDLQKKQKSIGEHIANQSWFFASWNNDPTIASMLTMLNAIESKVENQNTRLLWESMWGDKAKIVFYQLDMENLNLPDELYIKMNSRGKPLTDFEFFKSQFTEIIQDPEKRERFNNCIDKDWYDLFWRQLSSIEKKYTGEIKDIAKFVDESFLRIFRYLTNMLIARNQFVVDAEKVEDEISLYKKVYSDTKNINSLFKILDSIQGVNFEKYFRAFFYIKDEEQNLTKIRLFFANKSIQLFRLCCMYYDPSQRNNQFSIGEQLLFYATIYGLVNGIENPDIQLRKIRNLIANSDDTVRKENMYNLLVSVEKVMNGEKLDNSSKFNTVQIQNEIDKEDFLKEHEESRELLNKLEDNAILQGCTVVFDLDVRFNLRARYFLSVFNEEEPDFDTIKRAMFSFGDYSQFYGSSKSKVDKIKWEVWMHYQLGTHKTSNWRELLTPSNLRVGFDKTKTILLNFLDQLENVNMEAIIESYLTSESTEKDWMYYYIKYEECRYMPSGHSSWIQDKRYQYHSRMMNGRRLNGKNWSPYLYCIHKNTQENTSLENYDDALIVLNKNNLSFSVRNYNSWYVVEVISDNREALIEDLCTKKLSFKKNEENLELRYEIKQNTEFVDLEDRIEKGIELVEILSSY